MADSSDSTPPGAAEPCLAALYRRWRQILNEIDTVPGPPDARRFRRLEAAEAVEREIAATEARDLAGIILKLRMIQSARVCSLSEPALLAGALRDLEKLEEENTP